MDRRTFVAMMSGTIALGSAGALTSFTGYLPDTDTLMPVLFVGHGSPMNGIEDQKDDVSFFNDQAVAGSLTMTSVRFG